jgi:hypothetical protein
MTTPGLLCSERPEGPHGPHDELPVARLLASLAELELLLPLLLQGRFPLPHHRLVPRIFLAELLVAGDGWVKPGAPGFGVVLHVTFPSVVPGPRF